jgi:hypothetical protein
MTDCIVPKPAVGGSVNEWIKELEAIDLYNTDDPNFMDRVVDYARERNCLKDQ